MTPVEFRGDLWIQKTRVPGLSCGVVWVILRVAVLVEHRLVTDGQTDGHRAMAIQYRGCIASRGKKWKREKLKSKKRICSEVRQTVWGIHVVSFEEDKKLSYRRVTARCVLSVVILRIATQQCRNYLYKS